MNDKIWFYRIDGSDRIINYSPNFFKFAKENGWQEAPTPEKILRHSIFEFISGVETTHLYHLLFQKVRNEKKTIGPIPFRCDSPTERRYLHLTMRPLPENNIEIISELIKAEQRLEVKALKSNVSRSKKIITICSMCKKIAITSNEWVEIEEALVRLGFFEKDETPQLSHGLCPACFKSAMEEYS